MRSIRARLPYFAAWMLLVAGCSTLSHPRGHNDEAPRFPFSLFASRAPQPHATETDVRELLEAYRPRYERIMGDTLAMLPDTLSLGHPESPLGNFTADALRFRAARELRAYVHAGVIDRGSLGRWFLPGPVTRGQVHELMPYDNTLVVLTLTGAQIGQLTRELIAQPSFPMSGLRMSVTADSIGYVLIDRSPLEPERDYLLATSSWLAAGNGPYPSLWEPHAIQDTGIPLLDVFMEAFSLFRPEAAQPDQRVSVSAPRSEGTP